MLLKPNEINVSQIVENSSIPDIDYEINPYVGCSYRCIYCYAKYVKDHSEYGAPWGSFVDVKLNAAELIGEITKNYSDKEVFIGSVTDPYLLCEKDYEITRKILEKLVPLKPSISIQTKSDLVLRDIDLFVQFEKCKVGITINTLNDNLIAELEDATATVSQRLEILKQLKNAGIDTYVFMGPLLPELTDWKAIIELTREFASYYVVELLNIQGDIWPAIKNWLQQKHPELMNSYETIYFSDSTFFRPVNRLCWRFFGNSMGPANGYRSQIYDEIYNYARKNQVEVVFNDLLY